MDKIYIEKLEFRAYHGVFPEEKKLGQKFIVSLELELDTREAALSNNLDKTLHYGLISERVESLVLEKSYDLLESLAEKIAETLLLEYPVLQGIKVRVDKPQAPIPLSFQTVAIEIYRSWHRVYLSLGSNLGDKKGNLDRAIEEISSLVHTEVIRKSSFLETEPFGYLEQDTFVNACIEIKTLLTAKEVLKACLGIEEKMGRQRLIKWGPRNIDIDILFYDKEIYDEDNLVVPHPWIEERMFVLEPLCEIAPNYIHPILKKTIFMLKRGIEHETTL
ncbi:2-amino-4-hydroxy-6-hydroxymethyldihydropteridine diphosphokinase [Fusobacterium gonidiaformans]|uniref:2-amino-4-hydroxy-6- hydroxymethyldihydropteridine diphosphokinase n=1 Tax=Fusobacterium gonidiaformans TaxID=849 RepID=UPI0001BC655D|nr:2-amino-4-hydroxy-6-hydroxymethyldihydropteridine diphosphokinase [Fusobacterium gonidiaformans]AVQ16759.1 2-amino-4-hydroxy-6-hydroxymethyldihydropteridine diphosphokinase [Fusobacterium gonidiaformans ATCC 25563]EFS28334.1 2-amino-4-hydroxy-6-hydroxymethyldihydropteridine pyrophosphokinase [Fusobacterium gonidiaformans ATCC 25563]